MPPLLLPLKLLPLPLNVRHGHNNVQCNVPWAPPGQGPPAELRLILATCKVPQEDTVPLEAHKEGDVLCYIFGNGLENLQNREAARLWR